MNFDETNKVILNTLTKTEATVFVLFLESEIARHQMDIGNAYKLIKEVNARFGL